MFSLVIVLSFKTRFAERAPVPAGLNRKPILQLWPAARVEPEVRMQLVVAGSIEKSPGFVPVKA